jgi:glyoxylase-like metal-dependent hydrolase (beta-lactamase superfamily II)
MIRIHTFIFNDFGVNSYLLFDETNEAIIIDAACYTAAEKKELSAYIEGKKLKIVRQLDTHCHIDHILGNSFVEDTYGVGLQIHPDSEELLRMAIGYASVFGFEPDRIVKPKGFVNDGDKITFGNSELEILYTPGHANGSICFLNREQKFVITGDVLFNKSIGRTDLPGGDYDTLIKSIREKLMVLDDDTKVLCGHGPSTTIGSEREDNPFLR